MLVVKVFVNYEQIDEIHIQNVGEVAKGICQYKIRKPECEVDSIRHYRNSGWRPLVIRTLWKLEECLVGGEEKV